MATHHAAPPWAPCSSRLRARGSSFARRRRATSRPDRITARRCSSIRTCRFRAASRGLLPNLIGASDQVGMKKTNLIEPSDQVGGEEANPIEASDQIGKEETNPIGGSGQIGTEKRTSRFLPANLPGRLGPIGGECSGRPREPRARRARRSTGRTWARPGRARGWSAFGPGGSAFGRGGSAFGRGGSPSRRS